KTARLWDMLPRPSDGLQPDLVLAWGNFRSGWKLDEDGVLKQLSADQWGASRDALLKAGTLIQNLAPNERQIRNWHIDQAAQAEGAQQWFAVVFNLNRLIKMNPYDKDDLIARRDRAIAQLNNPTATSRPEGLKSADSLARHGNWQAAKEELAKVIHSDSDQD